MFDTEGWKSMSRLAAYYDERQRAEARDPELGELRSWRHLASFGGLCALVGEGYQLDIHRRRLLRLLGRRDGRTR